MPLLNLKSDFVFRTIFHRSPRLLISLLNATLRLKEDKEIKEIMLLSPEIPKETYNDKLSILDIKAIDATKQLFNIEIQAFPQTAYKARALYYWAKLFSSQIKEGDHYKNLSNTYSINFLDFKLFRERQEYISHFLIKERDDPNLVLTDIFQMVFIELPKFQKELEKIDDIFEIWLYLMNNSSSLEDKEMKSLVEKNPIMEETIDILKEISLDPKILSAEEARLKALRDYNSHIEDAIEQGIEKGIEKGIEQGAKASQMFSQGKSTVEIIKETGLTKEQLKALKLI